MSSPPVSSETKPRPSKALSTKSVVFSADSHVLEPGDLWTSHIDPAFRERAPHIEHSHTDADGRVSKGEFMVCEGIDPTPVALFAAADVEEPKLRAEMGKRGYDQLLSGGWDPEVRLKDQELDGVGAEIIYPSIGMPMFGIPETEFQQAVFRAYNNWLAEYCAYAPERLLGLAMITLDDVDWGVAEFQRARKLGLRGALIWNDPGPESYADRKFDPFWVAATDLEMPLSLHILTGKSGSGLDLSGKSNLFVDALPLHLPVQKTLTSMLTSGVFERHPALKLLSVENDIGWLAHFLFRLDHFFDALRYAANYTDPLTPTEYFRRNVWATFQDDPVGVATREFIGSDRLLWGSDYPHGDSTWPHSREAIERNFQNVDAAEVQAITHDNVQALYGIA